MAGYWTGYFGAPCYYPENLPSEKAMAAAADITPTIHVPGLQRTKPLLAPIRGVKIAPRAVGSYYVNFAATSGYSSVGRINDNKAWGTLATPQIYGNQITGSSGPKSGGLALTPGPRGSGPSSTPTPRSSVFSASGTSSSKTPTTTISPSRRSNAPDAPKTPTRAVDKFRAAVAASRTAETKRRDAVKVAAKSAVPSESPPLPPAAVVVPTSPGSSGGGFASGGGGGAWTADPPEFDETTDVAAPAEDGTAKRNKMLMIAGAAAVGLYLWSKRKK